VDASDASDAGDGTRPSEPPFRAIGGAAGNAAASGRSGSRDAKDRNPAWITHRLIQANGQGPAWSGCFSFPTKEVADEACIAFAAAGAARVTRLSGAAVLVEFEPTRVRRIAAAAVALRGTPRSSSSARRDP
jgi:hypothetical protein